MKSLIVFSLLMINLSQFCFAQPNAGARQIALAHSDVALSNDVFALFNNPSGLAQLNSREIGFFYSPSPFGIKELANGYFAYNEPTTLGSFSIGAMTYGFELYRENRFIIGYSKNITENIFFGLSTFYHSVNIERYGNEGIFNISFGGIFHVNNNFLLGFSLHNPLRLFNTKFELPLIYNYGITYKPFKNTSLNFAIIKEINFPFSLRFGIEYPIIEFLFLRIGVQNSPSLYNGGIGINYSFLKLNYAVSSHQELGLTHQFGLIISFN
jgi:hypothetical protein